MGATKGNQFWKERSKHGRDRIISEPVILADGADEYFQWCIDNPIIEIDYMNTKAGIQEIHKPHPRAFKKNELARFLHVAKWETIDQLKPLSNDFLEVITRIEGIIADQKYTYAVVGMFSAVIVARDLGLVEKTDNKNDNTTNLTVNVNSEDQKKLIDEF